MNYLLPLVYKLPFAPPLLNPVFVRKFAETQTSAIESSIHNPRASPADFARIQVDENNHSVPQAIAHRGYSSKYAENSIQSFEEAIKAGAHAIETDPHLTKDGVVVLSHDPDLRRSFSVDQQIIDSDWDLLKTLLTKSESPQPMATLAGLLELLVRSEADSVWLLLDIKTNNDPDDMFRAISTTLQAVKPRPGRPWKDRVMIGYWTAKYLPACRKYLPDFTVANIGFHTPYASQFLPVPDTAFVMFMASLASPYGRRFIQKSKSLGRPVIAWAVPDARSMEWCFEQGLDGILVDDMSLYHDVRNNYGRTPSQRFAIQQIYRIVVLNIWIYIFGLMVSREAKIRQSRSDKKE